MNAPKIWLQKYVDLSGITDKTFAEKMTFAGNKVEAIHKINGEVVYEFEITSNRPDTLSIIGLAREIAAIFNKKFTPPKIPQIKSLPTKPINLKIADKNLCPTYSAVEIANTTVKPSSHSIQKLLTLAGLRPVNNIVDITNLMLWEHAQLMHTFDADKIKGSLNLRLAKPKEKIITLDHKKRQLLGGEIIIEDQEKIIDVPGIMGGLNTEITTKTNRVFLLVAIDNPILIRRASKLLKLRSASSTRSEKQLDLTQTETVAKRVIKLMEKETKGKQSTKLITLKSSWKPPLISLNQSQITKRIGIDIPPAKINQYFKSLGIKKVRSKYQPPPWRRDLKTSVDLIEEIARLYGYNQLPRTLPTGIIPVGSSALKKNWVRTIKNIVASLGYTETYASTLISKKQIQSLHLNPKNHLKVIHPMSKDYEYMRTTIIETLIPFIKSNLKHTQKINIFELGTVFYPSGSNKKLPLQPLELGLVSTAIPSFAVIKGHLKQLAQSLNLQLTISPFEKSVPYLHISNQAIISLGNKIIGNIGQISPNILPDNKLLVWAMKLNLSSIITQASIDYHYPSLSQYPPIIEDLTFTLPFKTYLQPVIKAIKKTNKLINKVTLTKTYQQNYTFNIIYQSHTKPLTDALVAPIRKKIVSNLKQKFKAKLVGKLN